MSNETKIALVTGANRGIGKETARQLGSLGHTVVIGSRNADAGRAAADELGAGGIDATTVVLDVADTQSVAAAAKDLGERYGRLDVLVNNAGVLLDPSPVPSDTDVDVLRRTYETNVFGVVTVTNALLPLLRQSARGRIVNISSELGSMSRMIDPTSTFAGQNFLAYNSSKAAVNALTVAYASDLRDTAIKVNAADPGYCATDMNDHQGVQPASDGAAVAVTLATLPDDGPTGSFRQAAGSLPW